MRYGCSGARPEFCSLPEDDHRCLSSCSHKVFMALAVMGPFHTDVRFVRGAHCVAGPYAAPRQCAVSSFSCPLAPRALVPQGTFSQPKVVDRERVFGFSWPSFFNMHVCLCLGVYFLFVLSVRRVCVCVCVCDVACFAGCMPPPPPVPRRTIATPCHELLRREPVSCACMWWAATVVPRRGQVGSGAGRFGVRHSEPHSLPC